MRRLPRPVRASLGRVAEFWVYGTGPAALLLMLVAPAVLHGRATPVVLAYFALPAYMLHQVEEHDADRFRRFVNALLGPGHAGLTLGQVAVINLGFVWVPLALALVAVQTADHGWAAFPAWMMLVNASVHILQGIFMGGYNPGLATAFLIFVPLGTTTLVAAQPSPVQHVVSLGAVLALHAAIALVARSAPKTAQRGES